MCTGKTWVLSLKLTPTGSRNQDLSIFGKPTVRSTAADKLKWFWSSPHKRNSRYSNPKVFFPFISAVRIRKIKERKDLSIKKAMQPFYCLVARCLCKSSWRSFKSRGGLGLSREESICTAIEAPKEEAGLPLPRAHAQQPFLFDKKSQQQGEPSRVILIADDLNPQSFFILHLLRPGG